MLSGGFVRAGAAVRRGLATRGGVVARRTYAGKPVQPVPEQAELTANQVWLRGLFHEVSSSSERELHALHTQSVRMETEFHMAMAKYRDSIIESKRLAREMVAEVVAVLGFFSLGAVYLVQKEARNK